MREYAQLRPRFWIQGTGKQFRGDREARELALYLVSAPTSNLIGLYYLPITTIAHELGYETKDGLPDITAARAALKRVCAKEFAKYDDESEYVWVINMAREQVGDDAKKSDKRIIGVRNELRKHEKCPFYQDFCEHYVGAFGIQQQAPSKPLASPFEAPCKPLRRGDTSPGDPFEAPSISGTGAGSGSGAGSGAGERAWARELDRPESESWTPERQQVAFRAAWLERYQVEPSMGGKNVADFPARVLSTADARKVDPEALFRETLSRWLQGAHSATERRAPYACFAQAWGELLAASTAPETATADSPAFIRGDPTPW